MASLKEIKKRIQTVKSTVQITKAMQLIAAIRIKKIAKDRAAFTVYIHALENCLRAVIPQEDFVNLEKKFPLYYILSPDQYHTDSIETLSCRNNQLTTLLITSDRGLCGSYNAKLINAAKSLIVTQQDTSFICIGSKGYHGLSCSQQVDRQSIPHLPIKSMSYDTFKVEIMSHITTLILQKKAANINIIHSTQAHGVQEIKQSKLLELHTNLPNSHGIHIPGKMGLYTFEPKPPLLIKQLLRHYITAQIYNILLESLSSEYYVRMVAMDSAARNAKKITDLMQRLYNQTRQKFVTQELLEVISGMEAVQGNL